MNAADPSIPAGVALLAVTTILANRHNNISGGSLRTIASIVHSLRTEIPLETPLASNNTRFSQLLRSSHLNSDVAGALRSSWLSQEISKEDVFTPNLYLLSKDDPTEYEEILLHIDAYTITGAYFLNRYDALANVFEFLDKHFPKKKDVHGVGVVADLILGQDWAAAPCSSSTAQRRSIDSRLVAKKTLDIFSLHQPLRFPEFLSLVADCSMSLDEVSFHGAELCGRVVNTAFHDLDELRSRAMTSLYRHNDHREPTTLRDVLKAAVRSLDQEQYTTTSVTCFPRLLQVLVKDDALLENLGIRVEEGKQQTNDSGNTTLPVAATRPSSVAGAGRGVTPEPLRQRLALSLFLLLSSFPVVAFCNRQRVAMAEDYIQQRSKRRERPSTIFEEYADAFAAAVIKFAPLVFPMDLTSLANAAAVPSNTYEKVETGTAKQATMADLPAKASAAVQGVPLPVASDEKHLQQQPKGVSAHSGDLTGAVRVQSHDDAIGKYGHATLFPSQLTTDRAVESKVTSTDHSNSVVKPQPTDEGSRTAPSVKPKTFVGSFLDLKEEYAALMKEGDGALQTHMAAPATAPRDVVHVDRATRSISHESRPAMPSPQVATTTNSNLNAHEALVRDHIRTANTQQHSGDNSQRPLAAVSTSAHSLSLSSGKSHLDPLLGSSFALSATTSTLRRSAEFSASLPSQPSRLANDTSKQQQQHRSMGSLPSLAGTSLHTSSTRRSASPEELGSNDFTYAPPHSSMPSSSSRRPQEAAPLAHYVATSHYSSYAHSSDSNPLPMYRLDPRSLNVVLPSSGCVVGGPPDAHAQLASMPSSAASSTAPLRAPILQKVDVNAPVREPLIGTSFKGPYVDAYKAQCNVAPLSSGTSQWHTKTMNVVLPAPHTTQRVDEYAQPLQKSPLEGVVVRASQFLDERRRNEELRELEILLSNARTSRR